MDENKLPFTAKEFVAAVRQNNLNKITHHYFLFQNKAGVVYEANTADENDTIIGGCAIGQASVNLGIDPNTIYAVKLISAHLRILSSLLSSLSRTNDDESDFTLPEIADWVEKQPWYDPELPLIARKREYSVERE